jgi:Fe-Mn family superoxide dismutase
MNQFANQDFRPAEAVLPEHQLPPLTYPYTGLEPTIDARTMKLHHDMHHHTYVEKLNAALKKFPDLRKQSALRLLCNLDQVPEKIREAVHNNAGGHVNHSMLWRAMKPGTAGGPKGDLYDAINRDFGSIAAFKTQFEEAGAKQFGSGWAWLAVNPGSGGKLEVITTAGHDHPLMQQRYPLLLNDVWEHAYYLHYENRRPDYLKAWWSVIDWEEAARRLEVASTPAETLWDMEAQPAVAA